MIWAINLQSRRQPRHYIFGIHLQERQLIALSRPALCNPIITHQDPLSRGFSKQEYHNGQPFPSPGHLSHSTIEPGSPALQADSLLTEPPGNPHVGAKSQLLLYGLASYYKHSSKHFKKFNKMQRRQMISLVYLNLFL